MKINSTSHSSNPSQPIKGKNAHDMRANNIELIIKLLSQKKTCSRVELAKTLKLTQATITYIVRELLSAGIIVETDPVASQAKRPTLGLQLSNKFCTITLLMDRVLARVALVGFDGMIIEKHSFTYGMTEDPTKVMRLLYQHVKTLLWKYRETHQVIGIGISVPGPYIPHKNRIELMSGAPGWENIEFKEVFADLNLPVFVEHNANCGALSEIWYNQDNASNNLLYILAGYGIGAGLILDGSLYRGQIGTSGEIGHMSIDYSGERCECGNRGCLELYASVKKVEERYYKKNPDSTLSIVEILRLAEENDPDAAEALNPTIHYLAIALAGLTNVLGEEVIVISGHLAEAAKYLVPRLETEIKSYLLPSIAESIHVRVGILKDDDAVLIGASANVIEHLITSSANGLQNFLSKN